MKYLIPILCLFVFSCDELDSLLGDDDDIHGCLDSQACNYKSKIKTPHI